MLTSSTLKHFSHIFCGDEGDFYSYKTGPKLVSFFNENFGFKDVYGQGFPSRWAYVYDRLVYLLNNNKFNRFLDVCLSKNYIIREQRVTQVEAAEISEKIFTELNRLVKLDQCIINYSGNHYYLIKENEDLIYIDSGGFANVYEQKSTGHILKKLKDDFLTDSGVRSRFKREFEITKSLNGLFGIIEVYTFNNGDYSYTMEKAELTLEKYILDNKHNYATKINCISQILFIMNEVHKRDLIHRDISPNNIFIISGKLVIADFGLGKDLKVCTSHQTIHTNSLGQFSYFAPEQFMMLKEGDKRSDVYSLGRVINFIMTKDPRNSNHEFRSVAEKASNNDANSRYIDAGQLSSFFEKAIVYNARKQNQEEMDKLISLGVFNDEVENYIYSLDAEKISSTLLDEKKGFNNSLIKFMKIDETHAQHIVQSVENTYDQVCCGVFNAYDPFANFAYCVLDENFPFVIKEYAANILHYISRNINRFGAQRLEEELLKKGLDPLIEDILKS